MESPCGMLVFTMIWQIQDSCCRSSISSWHDHAPIALYCRDLNRPNVVRRFLNYPDLYHIVGTCWTYFCIRLQTPDHQYIWFPESRALLLIALFHPFPSVAQCVWVFVLCKANASHPVCLGFVSQVEALVHVFLEAQQLRPSTSLTCPRYFISQVYVFRNRILQTQQLSIFFLLMLPFYFYQFLTTSKAAILLHSNAQFIYFMSMTTCKP